MAARDRGLAEAIARAVRAVEPCADPVRTRRIRNVAAASAAGLPTAAEGFADRTYEPDGSLTPRAQAHAVLQDQGAVVRRAVRMAAEDSVVTTDGSEIVMRVDTMCIHGDTPGAPELARAVRAGLERAGIGVAAVGGAKP